MRHQEQQKLAEEQARVSALMSEKQDLELKLSELTKPSGNSLKSYIIC